MTAITSSSSANRCASVGATEAPVPPTAEPTTATRPCVLSSSWYVPSWFVFGAARLGVELLQAKQ